MVNQDEWGTGMKHICNLLIVVVASGFLPTLAQAAGVEVKGTAKVSVAPDIARFSFAVDGSGEKLAELKLDIDRKTAAVIALSKQVGVENKHISSAEVSIHPQYNHQTRELVGYQVSRSISVDLYQLDRYTALVNGAIDSGITTINSIQLDVKDRDRLEAEALAAAVKAARQKAEIIAENAGIQLGRIVSVQESGESFDNRRYAVKQMAMSEAAVSEAFEPGEISVTATVTVIYDIE